MILVWLVLMVIPILLIEAFFSGSEIAFLSSNKARLFQKAKANIPDAALAKKLLSDPETLFSTTVVGTTLAISISTSLTTLYILKHYGANAEWVNLVFLTPAILVFGEFIPKNIAKAHADLLVLKIARPMVMATKILFPVTRPLGFYAKFMKTILGDNPDKSFFLSREEIKAALPASRGSDVTPAERLLIERILEFGKITVKEMRRPLIDVVAVEENEPLSEAVRLFTESGHSRLPVYRERIDNIVGVIQGFDCIRASDLTQPVKSAMQPALYVPESKPLDEMLDELKSRPMAIAVDEYGGAEGILTMEDVMEEVVGEIEDEHDEPPKLFRQISQNSYIVNARIEIDKLNEALTLHIPPDDDYQTLAGFLLKRMQRIPKKWDSIIIEDVEYVVQSASDRSVEEVYVVVHPTNRS